MIRTGWQRSQVVQTTSAAPNWLIGSWTRRSSSRCCMKQQNSWTALWKAACEACLATWARVSLTLTYLLCMLRSNKSVRHQWSASLQTCHSSHCSSTVQIYNGKMHGLWLATSLPQPQHYLLAVNAQGRMSHVLICAGNAQDRLVRVLLCAGMSCCMDWEVGLLNV